MDSVVTHTKIPKIHEELIRLWDQEAGEDAVWASLFTIVFYSSGPARVKEYEEIVKHVVGRFPSRVIFINNLNNPDQPDTLRVSVSSETVGEGNLRIFCEIIRIEFNGNDSEQVPYLVIPHLLPDLPVYLLWTEDPAKEHHLLPCIAPYASRIIFDADSTDNLQVLASSILALSHTYAAEIGDLNWTAVSGWRHVLMETFNTRETFILLGSSHHVIITYNKPEEQTHQQAEIQAAYLQAWLASRLNWNYETFELVEGNIRISYRRPMNEVIVLLRPGHSSHLPPGTLLSLEICCALNEGHYQFQVQQDANHVMVHYSNRERCDIPLHTYLPLISPGREIIHEIFYQHSKAHYLGMLGVLTQIPWRDENTNT